QTTSDKAARINQWLHERTLDMQGLSAIPAIRAVTSRPDQRPDAEALLRHIKNTYGYYREIWVTDSIGLIRASSQAGRLEIGRAFQPSFVAESGRKGVFLSDVIVAVGDSEPAMYASGPVYSGSGGSRPIGVVIGRINLDQIDSVTKDIHLGQTAEAYLVNSEGYFVTGSRFEPGVRLRKRIDTKGLRDCLRKGRGVGMYRDYRNELVLGSYLFMPARRWCLLVEQDRTEALAPIRRIRHGLVMLTLLIGSLALGFVVITSNLLVQRIRRSDLQLEQKRKELSQSEKLASVGRLAAGIAHEINNPINSIQNCASLMLGRISKGQYDPDYFSRFLTSIEKECRRTARTIRDFLDFSRETEPMLAQLDLNTVLEETLVLLEPEATQQGVKIVRQFETRHPPVALADREQLKQVFRNIILNALQAMPNGGRLALTTRRHGSSAEVAIGDTGTGIDPANLDRIFDPFFTTKPGGSGLGLSVVYGIIDRHNGAIAVESKPGQGTTFTIRLPSGPKARRQEARGS
ncbi:MAG: ATP-binding protein, partial [candidate division WOR-3 bacterium]